MQINNKKIKECRNAVIVMFLCFIVAYIVYSLINNVPSKVNKDRAINTCYSINKNTSNEQCLNAKWLGEIKGINVVEVYTISGTQHWAYTEYTDGTSNIALLPKEFQGGK